MSAEDGSAMLEIAEAFPWLHGTWPGTCKEITKKVYIPAGVLTGHLVMAFAAGANEADMQEFINGVMSGQDLGGNDPRYHLRQKFNSLNNEHMRIELLRKNGGTKRKQANRKTRIEQVHYVRQAINAWLEQQEMSRLALTGPLPPVWRADLVRKYYREKVSAQ